MREVGLSQRLKSISAMVSVGNTVADVGCDHGFLSIYLVLMGIAPSVIASDLREGPLKAAKTHVTEYGLDKEIQIRLSDGLTGILPGETQTIILAGMGGGLMLDILKKGRKTLSKARELILQPQSDVPLVRGVFRENGIIPVDEDLILEEGKYYFPMKFELNEGKIPDLDIIPEIETVEDRYGPLLIKKKHPLLKQYLLKEQLRLNGILENLKVSRKIHAEKYRETALLAEEVRELVRDIEDQNR